MDSIDFVRSLCQVDIEKKTLELWVFATSTFKNFLMQFSVVES